MWVEAGPSGDGRQSVARGTRHRFPSALSRLRRFLRDPYQHSRIRHRQVSQRMSSHQTQIWTQPPGTPAMMSLPAAVGFPGPLTACMTFFGGDQWRILENRLNMAICCQFSQWNSATLSRNNSIRPSKKIQRSQTWPSMTENPMQSSKLSMELLESIKMQ